MFPLTSALMPKRRRPSSAGAAATMAQIAELAGVSAMTVSRALRGDRLVSKPTRERILALVDQTGYVPDATARMFATRRTGFVAALVPSLNNSNFADTVRGLARVLDASGLQMLLGDTEYTLAREESLIRTLLGRRPEALVLTGGDHTPRARKMLAQAKIPIVETWDVPAVPLGHTVGFSNREAGATMVRYLQARGRCRIGFIGGAADADSRGAERRLGYEAALAEAGLGPRAVAAGHPSASMSEGAGALDALLARWPDTDAVLCVSDLAAFGVLAHAQRRGIAVPADLAIAGFGDFEIARCCHPRLTTLAVDCTEIGAHAGRIVLEALAARDRGDAPGAAQSAVVALTVIERETA